MRYDIRDAKNAAPTVSRRVILRDEKIRSGRFMAQNLQCGEELEWIGKGVEKGRLARLEGAAVIGSQTEFGDCLAVF